MKPAALPPDTIERTRRYLFASEEEMERARLPRPVRLRLLRLRDLYTLWISRPQLTDAHMTALARERHAVSLSTAYDDLRLVKLCLGDMARATADWYRWLFLQRAEESFQRARDKDDPRAFAQTLAALGKYTRLDAPEERLPDWSQIVPQPFELTADPEAAGFRRIPDAERKARRLLARYIREAGGTDEEPPPDPRPRPPAGTQ